MGRNSLREETSLNTESLRVSVCGSGTKSKGRSSEFEFKGFKCLQNVKPERGFFLRKYRMENDQSFGCKIGEKVRLEIS